ncbi:MAG TPA: hypothetical protein ENK53_04960 [Thiotrichales bacterium]|nr:hypothetical protein [Thiotrichales bacterium]
MPAIRLRRLARCAGTLRFSRRRALAELASLTRGSDSLSLYRAFAAMLGCTESAIRRACQPLPSERF